MKATGLNSEQTKRSNRLLVLRLLSTMGGGSRTELTQRVHLAKMTVSNITAELLRNGVICEKETIDHSDAIVGRKQMRLGFSDSSPVVLGIWLSRDCCTGIAAAMDLTILGQHAVPLGPKEEAASLLDKLESLSRQLLAELPPRRPVIGLGIASIGPLDISDGALLNPPNFFGIQNLPLARLLEEELKLPVFLENDTNAGALAEKYFGCCAEVSNFAYIGLANGLGAGIVVRDSLLHGQNGFAGEFGHMVIDRNGKQCYCGRRGCLETEVAVPCLLADAAREWGHALRDLRELCAFCGEDPARREWLHGKLAVLAAGLANLANILDPAVFVIGHDGAALDDESLEYLSQQINGALLAAEAGRVSVARSAFGQLAPVYGAAAVVLRRVFAGELWYEQLFGEN